VTKGEKGSYTFLSSFREGVSVRQDVLLLLITCPVLYASSITHKNEVRSGANAFLPGNSSVKHHFSHLEQIQCTASVHSVVFVS
jgi:hypothetical protein